MKTIPCENPGCSGRMAHRSPDREDNWPGGFECGDCGSEIVSEYRGERDGDVIDWKASQSWINRAIDRAGGPGFHAGRLLEAK